MAILKNDCGGFRGAIAKTVVVRQYKGRTILSAYPDMSKVKPSQEQKKYRLKFAQAQQAAKDFLADPTNKSLYRSLCDPGQRPHNRFIAEWMRTHSKPE